MDVETEMHFLMDSKQVGTIYLLKLNSEDVFKIYNSAQDKQKICKNIFVRKTMSNKSNLHKPRRSCPSVDADTELGIEKD